jgi:hypothetical protein
MPPLKPGKVVSQTGKVVNTAPKVQPTSNKGESAQAASTKAKALNKPQSESVQAAQKQAAGIKASQKLNENAYKKSIPSLNSSFKGVGVAPYIGSKTEDKPEVIAKSSGPSGDNSGGGSGSADQDSFQESNPAMDPTPTPTSSPTTSPEVVVKTPTRNVTDISSLVPQFNAEQIQKLLFENLSAIELSKVERHDTIEGIDQKYSIISNLSEIRKKYDIIKQLTIMDKFKPLTSIYTINIQDKIPQEDYIALESLDSTYQYLDENNQIVTREKGHYYIDTNGDLVIELINLERNQQVEVLIDTNGTIYKVES